MNNIFARIGEVISGGDDLVWRDELAAAGGDCADMPWCGGTHRHDTIHVRRVASVARPDGTLVLDISVQQLPGWHPAVYVGSDDQDEPGLTMNLGDADSLTQLVYYSGGQGERLAESLMAAVGLLSQEIARQEKRRAVRTLIGV